MLFADRMRFDLDWRSVAAGAAVASALLLNSRKQPRIDNRPVR